MNDVSMLKKLPTQKDLFRNNYIKLYEYSLKKTTFETSNKCGYHVILKAKKGWNLK